MYKITYEDNSTFLGGSPENSKWNSIEDKPIKKLEYVLGNRMVIMEGYDGYNHLIKYALKFHKNMAIRKIILMGVKNNKVTKIIFNIKKHSIERQNALFGKEYNNKCT